MKAILFFEDLKKVVDDFKRDYLDPELVRLKKETDVDFGFVPYFIHPTMETTPRRVPQIVSDAAGWLAQRNELERLVFVVDLSPTGDDGGHMFGFQVVSQLARSKRATYLSMQLADFLSFKDYLVVICSSYVQHIDDAVKKEADWAKVSNLRQIRYKNPPQVASTREKQEFIVQEAARAIGEIRASRPRIVAVNRTQSDQMIWFAKIIAEWI